MRQVQNRIKTKWSENATAIVRMWEIGNASLAFYGRQHGDIVYGTKKQAMLDECQRLQKHYRDGLPIKPDLATILKYWKVAEEFSELEIHGLANDVSDCNSTFAPTHLMRCLAVPNLVHRRALVKKAVKASWSKKEIDSVVHSCGERRSQVSGRRPQVSDDPAGRIVQAEKVCITWLRWFDMALPRFEKQDLLVIREALQGVRKVQVHFHCRHERRFGK